MSNELVEQRTFTAADIRAQVNLIQEVMKAVMIKDTHYGTIPGCPKPTLYKPGAEKLLVTFRIASEPIVEDLSTQNEARYRVTRRGTSILTGVGLGSGIGECSSNEEKYKWRGAVCKAEFEATPENSRRIKYKRDGSTIEQVRVNHADVANTILKMADKRAYVALSLNTTAASDIFTQDIEDLPEGMDVGEEGQKKEPIAAPKKASESKPAAGGNTLTFVPVSVAVKKAPDGSWTKYGISDGRETYGTFSDTLGEIAQAAADGKTGITLTWELDAKTGKYKNATSVVAA